MNHNHYHYEYRRPRWNNPTYASSNVNNSITFFNEPIRQKHQGVKNQQIPNLRNSSHQEYNNLRSSSHMDYSNNYVQKSPSSYQNYAQFAQNQPRQPSNYPINRIIKQESQRVSSRHAQTPIRQAEYAYRNDQKQAYQGVPNYYEERPRANSHLSNYGTNSLSFNQKDIFNKQNSRYNIINVKPKDYDDSIRQFPKFTLQNKDQFYFQKLKAQQKLQQFEKTQQQRQLKSVLAGKKTFMADPNKIEVPNTYFPDQKKYFTPKMLNHADQIGNLI